MKDIDYKKYESRMNELYPALSEEEKRNLLEARFEYWGLLIDNFSTYFGH